MLVKFEIVVNYDSQKFLCTATFNNFDINEYTFVAFRDEEMSYVSICQHLSAFVSIQLKVVIWKPLCKGVSVSF